MSITQQCVVAESQDIEGIIRLRRLLLSQGSAHYVAASADDDAIWQEYYRRWLYDKLSNQQLNIKIYVIRDLQHQVIGCATGIIDDRAPTIGILNGLQGWVQSVVIDPKWRRKGLATRLMQSLYLWFQEQQVGKIALQATPEAEEMYLTLGFSKTGEDLFITTVDG